MIWYWHSLPPGLLFSWGHNVLKRIPLFSIAVLLGLGTIVQPVRGQALLPYTPQLDAKQLEQQGLSLIQEAVGLARFQQYEPALQRANLATQLAPKTYQSWFLLGSLYLETEKLDKGIEALERARLLAPKEAEILFALGSAKFQKADYQGAIASLEAGLKLKPDVPTALFDLGNTYYKLKQFEPAIAQYQKVVAKDAKFWPAINNIGLIKYETGDVKAALDHWRQAIAIDNKAAEPHLAIGVALYAQGDREQGLAMGETAIRLDNRYADLEFLKENLWGDRLLGETKKFLEIPKIRETIASSQQQPTQIQVPPQ